MRETYSIRVSEGDLLTKYNYFQLRPFSWSLPNLSRKPGCRSPPDTFEIQQFERGLAST